jgi:hypothetical protein
MRRLIAFVTVALIAVGFAGVGPASATDPVNQPPTGRFAFACYQRKQPTANCDRAALANINRAHKAEGIGKLVLPANYASLTVVQQEVAVSNAERTSRGIPTLPENKAYDRLAHTGTVNGTDPTGPSDHGWGSIFVALADPLAADYFWMYWDGPGSLNPDCVNPGDSGCFGHRNIILFPDWTSMGAGHANGASGELFVE